MKFIDPFYWYLRLILNRFLKTKLKKEELEFVDDNIKKHRLIQWINIVAAIFIILTLKDTSKSEISIVITSLIAPVMVMGGAWFAITFGSIPKNLIDTSMAITFWMFTAFKLSLSAMFISIGFISSYLLWPVLIFIYIAVDISCIQYDTVDALKAGLDEAVLKHSRAALLYYEKKEGINLEEEEKK